MAKVMLKPKLKSQKNFLEESVCEEIVFDCIELPLSKIKQHIKYLKFFFKIFTLITNDLTHTIIIKKTFILI